MDADKEVRDTSRAYPKEQLDAIAECLIERSVRPEHRARYLRDGPPYGYTVRGGRSALAFDFPMPGGGTLQINISVDSLPELLHVLPLARQYALPF